MSGVSKITGPNHRWDTILSNFFNRYHFFRSRIGIVKIINYVLHISEKDRRKPHNFWGKNLTTLTFHAVRLPLLAHSCSPIARVSGTRETGGKIHRTREFFVNLQSENISEERHWWIISWNLTFKLIIFESLLFSASSLLSVTHHCSACILHLGGILVSLFQ